MVNYVFWTRTTTTGDQLTLYQIRVKLASDGPQDDPTGYTTIQQWTENTLNATYNIYEEKVVNFSATYIGQQVYVAFVKVYTQTTASIGGDRWLVDDVQIVAQCLPPTGLTATALSTTANLSWTSSATSWEIEVVPASTTPTGVGVSYSGTLPYNITGLTPNTSYQYCVRANCGGGNYSTWVCNTFTTTPAATGCNSQFTDPGGATGNYANNANVTTTNMSFITY
jgi:hypothetical protein